MYVQHMSTREKFQNDLTVLEGRPLMTADGTKDISASYKVNAEGVVPFFMERPVEERLAIAAEIAAFWKMLDTVPWSDPDEGRNYVINYLYEMNPYTRAALSST